jgi:hypothetical protein
MVPKLFPAGKSFKKLAAYLLHDPDKAKTAERVRWTHTLNLASDRPASAIDEMLWTVRGADWLKQQSNVPPGGRPLENPVKHFSLNWHPSETPTREQMIEGVEGFLSHMGWQEHQALIVCHDDKHPHVHVMLNAVHPDTGRALDTSFEKRRAQEWAKAYEGEHGLIFCEERLKPKEERHASPTRETWEKMKRSEREHDRAEYQRVRKDFDYFARNDDDKGKVSEWEALKAHQRAEREAFFKEGKQAYRSARNEVFREVRAEFRDQWREFYHAKRAGQDGDQLAAMKADILSAQNARLDERRTAACAVLREQRDLHYEKLLSAQKQERTDLGLRQKDGLRSPRILDAVYRPGAQPTESSTPEKLEHTPKTFRKTSKEICEPASDRHAFVPSVHGTPSGNRARVRDGLDAVGGLGLGALGAIAAIGERLFDGFFGGGETQATNAEAHEPVKSREEERADAVSLNASQKAAESQSEEAARLQAYWQERRQRRRERD